MGNARDARPLFASKFFYFHVVFGNDLSNNRLAHSLRNPGSASGNDRFFLFLISIDCSNWPFPMDDDKFQDCVQLTINI